MFRFYGCGRGRCSTDDLKKGRWGAHYYPTDTMIDFLGRKIRRDGKRVRAAIKDVMNDGYLLVYKSGDTISLNPARSKEIIEFVSRNLR